MGQVLQAFTPTPTVLGGLEGLHTEHALQHQQQPWRGQQEQQQPARVRCRKPFPQHSTQRPSPSSTSRSAPSNQAPLNLQDDPPWLRDHRFNHQWLPGGLPGGARSLPLHWRAATAGPNSAQPLPPALSVSALGSLPVLVVDANDKLPPRTVTLVDTARKCRQAHELRRGAYTEEHLMRQGLWRLRQSCAVVEGCSGTVLGLFLTGNEYPDLLEATANHRRLHSQLVEVYGGPTCTPRADNSTITMHGLRWPANWRNTWPADPHTGCRALCFGYYRAANAAAAARLETDKELRDSITGTCSATCAIERRYAPAMGAYRLAVAKQQRLPGILPGVPPEVCSTSMIGSSLGYVSSPHRDGHREMPPMPGLSETIAYRGAKACFGLLKGGVLMDLSVSEACLVMVPADDMHGTLSPPPGVANDGIGVVIAAAKHLETSAAAMVHKEEFIRRAAERQAALAARLATPSQLEQQAAGQRQQQGQLHQELISPVAARASAHRSHSLGPVATALVTGGVSAVQPAHAAAVAASEARGCTSTDAGADAGAGAPAAATGSAASGQQAAPQPAQVLSREALAAGPPIGDGSSMRGPAALPTVMLVDAPSHFDEWEAVGGSFWQRWPLYRTMDQPT